MNYVFYFVLREWAFLKFYFKFLFFDGGYDLLYVFEMLLERFWEDKNMVNVIDTKFW